ncbi:Ulp1 peptidase protein [Dioscorea alata]|uniref:Ulp1 peptidase protein n=1 Tax=Dioscorea alata TaxID=55571 RepID=A0ACB7W5L7_DIOAL|nr:Ulp1 peptidase protein [Dioscorea alata]
MVRAPLELDWSEIMRRREDGPTPEVEVVPGDGGAEGGGEAAALAELSDHQLSDKIQRISKMLSARFHYRLPDRGAKLLSSFKQMQAELDRRKLVNHQKKENEKSEASSLTKTGEPSSSVKVSSSSDTTSSHLQSSFASSFLNKLEDKTDISCDKDLKSKRQDESKSSRASAAHLHQDVKPAKKVSGTAKPSSGQKSTDSSAGEDKVTSCSVGPKGINNSNISYHGGGNITSGLSKRRRASEIGVSSDLKLKKARHLVLLDDEDAQPTELVQGDSPDERMELKIYYPSRNDPEAVELSYSAIKCLEPESYLSSPIMNFYIQYLQGPSSPVAKLRSEYHFFNTYFYSKLVEALSFKGDRSASFLRLRRWWKGVNIFQKAYIFLPIHGEMHWSLVIICIPPKDEETGPTILHLDSLGLHSSNSVFDIVDSYLKEEWKYINENAAPPSDLPISERIWKNLPRRIEKRKITVPQQKNEYDCGLFVLYFMERFIADAPERLRRKDHNMFGRRWFKPEDASSLRKRIHCLLAKEFEKARLVDSHRSDSPVLASSSVREGEE